jgi:hypothetical protein
VQLSRRSAVVHSSDLQKTLASQAFTPGIYNTARAMHDMDALCAVNLVLCAVKFVGFLPFKTTRLLWNTIAAALTTTTVITRSVATSRPIRSAVTTPKMARNVKYEQSRKPKRLAPAVSR